MTVRAPSIVAPTSAHTGFLLAGGSSAAVGSSVAALSLLTTYPYLQGQAVRYLVGAAILLLLGRGRIPPLRWREVPQLLTLAATGMAGFNVLILLALRHTEPSVVGSVLGGVPLVLALAGPLLARRLPSWRVVTGAVMIVAGTVAVQWTQPDASLVGLVLAVAAMLCEVGFTVLALPLLARLRPIGVATYGSAAAALLLFVAAAVTDAGSVLVTPAPVEAAALLYLAAIVTAAAFFMWYLSLDRIPVELAGLFAGMIPVVALLTSVAVVAETLTAGKLAGVLTVAAGIVLGVSARRSDGTGPTVQRHARASGASPSDAIPRRDEHAWRR